MTPLFARQQSPDRVFERLYQSHVQDVYRYALMVMRNREDAEDVVQTTFLKAYRVFARGERPRNPRPWLITIAHNTCRTRLRDAMRRPQEVAFDERVAEAPEPERRDGVEPKELLRALGALSFNQRSALVMRELEGRSYAEIAKLLEVTPSAVETLLFRARRAVREQLEGALTCGEAERSLSLDLDGRLTKQGKSHLRAHLRTCGECASLARRQRARRAALRGFGPLPLPGSLASWGGGTAAGTGIGAKIAAALAAGAAAVGVGYQAADAVSDPVARAAAGTPAAASAQPAGSQFAALWPAGANSRSNPGFASKRWPVRLPKEYSGLLGLIAASGAGGSPALSTPAPWIPHAPAGVEAFLGSTLEAVPAGVTTPAAPAVPPLQPQLPMPTPQPPVQAPPLPTPPSLPAPSPQVPVPTPQLPAPAPQLPAPVPQLPAPVPQLPAPAPQLPVQPPPLPSAPPVPPLPITVAPPQLPPPPAATLPTAPVDGILP
jgi:RNA polymerase sigma factor (sigma-70 family)